MLPVEQARPYQEQLGCPQAAAVLDSPRETAAHRQQTYAEFLADLLGVEVAARRERSRRTRTRLAPRPFLRTLEQFDFSFQPSIDERQIRELATLTFVAEAAHGLFLGPPGVGKTHLAVALGLRAIEHGYGVSVVRAQDLLEDLRRAQAEHRLDRRLRIYLAPKLLIIDACGLWSYDRTAATALFALIAARYERGRSILTSNKGFAEWGEVLGDAVIATAVLDRLIHPSDVVNIRGESYRLREKKRAGWAPPRPIPPGGDGAGPSTAV
ncbi:MAG: IS21-like element helper ATPase IstB [Actinomycetia bacterium]|nr:IS21-like element helper ATPase IstB [Actinomycetes bacterium]